jgi:hypothetical protein
MRIRALYLGSLIASLVIVALSYRTLAAALILPTFPYGSDGFFVVTFAAALVALLLIGPLEARFLWRGLFGSKETQSSLTSSVPPVPIAIGTAVGLMSGLL